MLINFGFLQANEGWEEFFDYIFPEDEASKPNLKLLSSAKAWKRKMLESDEGNTEQEGQAAEGELKSRADSDHRRISFTFDKDFVETCSHSGKRSAVVRILVKK